MATTGASLLPCLRCSAFETRRWSPRRCAKLSNRSLQRGCCAADHRGTPQAPGRTVTLVPGADARTWGMAYKLPENLEERRRALQVLTASTLMRAHQVHQLRNPRAPCSASSLLRTCVEIQSPAWRSSPNYGEAYMPRKRHCIRSVCPRPVTGITRAGARVAREAVRSQGEPAALP